MARRLLVTYLLLLGLTACPESGPAPTDECTRTGDQCRLRDGLLGVCTPGELSACAEPPCLTCMPQH